MRVQLLYRRYPVRFHRGLSTVLRPDSGERRALFGKYYRGEQLPVFTELSNAGGVFAASLQPLVRT